MHPVVLADGWTDLEGDEKALFESDSYSSLVWDFGKSVGEEFVVEGWSALRYKKEENGDVTEVYVVYTLGNDIKEPVEVLFSEPSGGTRTVSYVKSPTDEWCFGCEEFAKKITLASIAVLIMTVAVNL